jgi:hypothetical protein
VTNILGGGVAANCCAHLLGRAGVGVVSDQTSINQNDRPKIPALLIGTATQALIEDVFERKDVFHGAQRISRRIVAWGSRGSEAAGNPEPVEVPHSAVVISEQDLVARLRPAFVLPPAGFETHRDTAAWTIVTSPAGYAMRTKPGGLTKPGDLTRSGDLTNVSRHFGSRIAHASAVQLKTNCASDACWIESLESGWLFLLPGPTSAWLLSVGGPHSRMVAAQIESLGAPAGQFPAYPRVSDPLCGDGWLACGNAAMAFDPICGDGTGNAIREAILACAVIRAAARPETNDKDALLAHFRTRLLAGFLKHLELCRQFYAACSGKWWIAELERLDDGIAWCREQLGGEPRFRYRLRGFELEPVLGSLSKKG